MHEWEPIRGLLQSIRICDNVEKEYGIPVKELPAEIRLVVSAYRDRVSNHQICME